MQHLRYGFIAIFLVAVGAGGAWAWTDSANCTECHVQFAGPGAATHDAHTSVINGCTYCHTTIGDTPDTRMSGADANNSCSGCHVLGGVNRHHSTTGAHSCGCHNSVTPIAESDVPPYYGTAATDLRFSCFDGLDNDGDDIYDGDDSDCIGVPSDERSWGVIKQIYGDE